MEDVKDYIGKTVTVIIERKLGDKHSDEYPKHIYPLNYGYIPGTISGDGEELDAYVIGVFEPVEEYTGKVIAIIHRIDNNDDKLIVSNKEYTDEQIVALTEFQERFFKSEIIR